jgi:hypothetical protein
MQINGLQMVGISPTMTEEKYACFVISLNPPGRRVFYSVLMPQNLMRNVSVFPSLLEASGTAICAARSPNAF